MLSLGVVKREGQPDQICELETSIDQDYLHNVEE